MNLYGVGKDKDMDQTVGWRTIEQKRGDSWKVLVEYTGRAGYNKGIKDRRWLRWRWEQAARHRQQHDLRHDEVLR